MPTDLAGGSKVLPPNPVAASLGATPVKAGSTLPPNPLTFHQTTPAAPNVEALAQHIATTNSFAPAFVKQLQAYAKADPTFQAQLNAHVARISHNIIAQQNASPSGIIGNVVEQTANPLEWGASGIRGIGELSKGHLGSGALDLAAVVPVSRGPRAVLEGVRAAHAAEEGARVAEGVRAAKAAYRARKGVVGGLVGAARRKAIPDFSRGIPAAEADRNLKQFTNPKNLGKGAAQNAPFHSLHPDVAGLQVVGKITPEQWWARTQHAVGYDQALGLKLAHWYRELGPMFDHYFGADAPKIIRGFAVSQANASPAGGLLNVLRVRDKLMRGEQILPTEISTVVKSIEAAFKGEHVSSGMQAKLHDFADSLDGKTTRTWTGDNPAGGSPTAIDIHAQRDLGRIDPKILSTLRDRHGLPVAHLQLEVMQRELSRLKGKKLGGDFTAAAKSKAVKEQAAKIRTFRSANADDIRHGRESGLVLDNPQASASGNAYNDPLREYANITDYLNAIGAWGKHDWTPAEAQALGWSAIQRIHGTVPEDALFAIDRNTHNIAAEIGHGEAQTMKSVRDELPNIHQIVQGEGGILRDLRVMHGGWAGEMKPHADLHVIASPEQADRIAQRLANVYHQDEVWAMRPGVVNSRAWGRSRFALELESQAFKTKDGIARFVKALHNDLTPTEAEHLSGFSQFTYVDPATGETRYGLRFITGHGYEPLGSEAAMKRVSQYAGTINRALDKAGIESAHLEHNNVEVRRLRGEADNRAGAPAGAPGESAGHLDPAAGQSADVGGGTGSIFRSGAAAVGRALADESGSVNLSALFPEPVRSAEEAHSHLLDAAQQARAEGFGGGVGGKGHPPLVEKGVATDATGGALGQKIREALVHASDVRAAQKAGYSEERSARVRAASEASQQAGGGMSGHLAAKRHLSGELPKEFFGHLKDFTPEDLHQAAKVVDQAPLQFFEKTHVKDALAALVNDGVVPTKGDQALLERVFGRVAGTAAPDEKVAGFWDKFVSALNIPRALRSSGDISAGFRQGLVVLVTHPNVFRRQWVKMIKEFGSEDFYRAEQDAIHNDPLYPLMHKFGVPFTEIGGAVKGEEEAFVGAQAAEHIPLGVGKVVRMSDRAFTGFQNGTRAELFKLMAEKAAVLGHDFNGEGGQHLGESIARVVGTFTGRGTVPKMLESHLTTLNAAMFSPRLMASRMNLLSPVYYAKLDPFARREAIAGARNVVAAIGATMFVAKLLGAQVNFDPRSSNFTKIKIGNTRIDIAGGFSQYVRVIAQEMTGEAISSSGHASRVRLPGQSVAHGDISTLGNLTKFARSKAAPIPSILWDEASGSDFIGRPVKQGHELFSNAPFVSQDAYDALQNSGPKSVAIAAFLSAIGLGVQSYKDKAPGGNSGGGSGYGDSGGYGGGSSYGDSGGGYGG